MYYFAPAQHVLPRSTEFVGLERRRDAFTGRGYPVAGTAADSDRGAGK